MVNVNTVYKTVLYILNKEQRGFITPDEFNTLGTQVQREIFEAYFEELNQQLRVPQNDSEYANRVSNLQEKIDIFNTSALCTYVNPHFTLPDDVHRIGSISYAGSDVANTIAIQKVGRSEYTLLNSSPLTKPSIAYPVYIAETTGAPSAAPSQILVYPSGITNRVTCNYVKAPVNPRWGYSVGGLGQYVYDSTTYNSTAGSLVVLDSSLTSSITTNTVNGIDAVYTGATFNTNAVSTSGSGTGAQLTVTVSGNTVTNVTVTTAGSGYAIGDTITISDSAPPNGIGGTTPVVITLTADDLYSDSTYGSTQFELHPTEQTNLILQILMYSGVVIRDPQIVQTAANMVQQDEVLEKS
mgnify:CR=1 FL=1|tara:strand:+ start:1283 stop:2344 length:1062 start_codon:yes stop_codon:yes gene_type:complete